MTFEIELKENYGFNSVLLEREYLLNIRKLIEID